MSDCAQSAKFHLIEIAKNLHISLFSVLGSIAVFPSKSFIVIYGYGRKLAAPFHFHFHQLPFKKAASAVGVVAGKTVFFRILFIRR